MNTPLTPEQIQAWRNVLVLMVGPYALIMPESEIIALRDKFQAQAQAESEADAE